MLNNGWLSFLDIFFIVFHSLIVVFNLTGWIWAKTRKWHLGLIVLTAFSWFVLGIWYGWGYCFCTDWHWQVRIELGDYTMPHSYMKFLLDKITGLDWNAFLVDKITLLTFVAALGLSLYLNVDDWREKRKRSKESS